MQELKRFRDAWVAACLAFDEPAAERAFQEALSAFPPEVACTAVLREGLAQIGEAWYRVTRPSIRSTSRPTWPRAGPRPSWRPPRRLPVRTRFWLSARQGRTMPSACCC